MGTGIVRWCKLLYVPGQSETGQGYNSSLVALNAGEATDTATGLRLGTTGRDSCKSEGGTMRRPWQRLERTQDSQLPADADWHALNTFRQHEKIVAEPLLIRKKICTGWFSPWNC